MKRVFGMFMILCFFIMICFQGISVQAVDMRENKVVSADKVWTINFNQEISLEGNADKILVKDSKGNPVKDIRVSLGENGKTLLIGPPQGGYSLGENYTLTVNQQFRNKKDRTLKEDIILPFAISPTVKEIHSFYPEGITYGAKTESFIKSVDNISFAWSSLVFESSASKNSVKITTYYDNKSKNREDIVNPLKAAAANGKTAQLSLFADDNGEATYKILTNILPYEDKRNALIDNILSILKEGVSTGESLPFKFNGVTIDFEGLRDAESINEKLMSEYYVQFLKELNEKLKAMDSHQKLYAAVNVDVNFNGYDYANIIKNTDKLILMAHDYEPVGNITKADIMKYVNYSADNNINSLAPIAQVENALKKTVQGIYGEDLSKILLQISFDSAQWQFTAESEEAWNKLEGSALSISHDVPFYSSIKARIDSTQVGSGYIKALESPYITYYNETKNTYNFILYEDSRSVQAKIDIANKYGIGGISLWGWGNIPDYDDAKGKDYHLDVWQQIQKAIFKRHA